MEHVTSEQIDRIELIIHALAKRENPLAMGIERQIKDQSPAEKRRLILGFYGKTFEFMVSVQMAMDSTRTVEQIKAALGVL